MSVSSGTRIGSYELIGSIGAGGMGQVFHARDTELNRNVAIKVLPAAFADDPERLARFTREAQTLASLNHPNIATIHGIEEIASSASQADLLPRNPCENGPFQPISVIASPATDGSGRSNLSSRRDCFGPKRDFGSLAMTLWFLSTVTDEVREGLAVTKGAPSAGLVAMTKRAGASRALVMELIEGGALSDHIRRGPITIAEALPIARQIAEALEAARSRARE